MAVRVNGSIKQWSRIDPTHDHLLSVVLKKKIIELQLIYNVVFISRVQQRVRLSIYTRTLFHVLLHCCLLEESNTAPCAVQQDLAIYPFYM